MAKAPTLTDIRNLIAANHEEVQERLTKVEAQVILTNGRVKDLELQRQRDEAVAQYIASQEAQSGSNLKRLSQVMVWVVPLAIFLVEAFIWLGRLSK